MENKQGKQLLGADDALAYLDHHRTKDITKDDGLKPKELFHTHGSTSFYVTSADKIKPLPILWIWEKRIPMGMLGIMSGGAGCGKSSITCDIAARLSRGMDWGDGAKNTIGPQTILIAATEDDIARTMSTP